MNNKCYISGPITGMPALNRFAFAEAVIDLACLGYSPVDPFSVCDNLPKNSSWSDYMRQDIPELCQCQYIFMLPGWWKSRGAIIERIIAMVLGIKRIDITRT
jgi:hypothetical protein